MFWVFRFSRRARWHHMSGIEGAEYRHSAAIVRVREKYGSQCNWYSSILGGCSSDARSSSKPSKPLNSGSKRPPPSERFSRGHHDCCQAMHPPPPFPFPSRNRNARLSVLLRRISSVFPALASCRGRISRASYRFALAHLVEADVLGLLTEALTAQVKVVLSDQTGLVLADAAIQIVQVSDPL